MSQTESIIVCEVNGYYQLGKGGTGLLTAPPESNQVKMWQFPKRKSTEHTSHKITDVY